MSLGSMREFYGQCAIWHLHVYRYRNYLLPIINIARHLVLHYELLHKKLKIIKHIYFRGAAQYSCITRVHHNGPLNYLYWNVAWFCIVRTKSDKSPVRRFSRFDTFSKAQYSCITRVNHNGPLNYLNWNAICFIQFIERFLSQDQGVNMTSDWTESWIL